MKNLICVMAAVVCVLGSNFVALSDDKEKAPPKTEKKQSDVKKSEAKRTILNVSDETLPERVILIQGEILYLTRTPFANKMIISGAKLEELNQLGGASAPFKDISETAKKKAPIPKEQEVLAVFLAVRPGKATARIYFECELTEEGRREGVSLPRMRLPIKIEIEVRASKVQALLPKSNKGK